MKWLIIFLYSYLYIFLFVIPLASGVIVYPQEKEIKCIKGIDYSFEFRLVNPRKERVNVTFLGNDYFGGISYNLLPYEERTIKLVYSIPDYVKNGIIENKLHMIYQYGSSSNLDLALGTLIKIQIDVTGQEVISFNIQSVDVLPCERGGDCLVNIGIRNNGTVLTIPSIMLYDSYGLIQSKEANLMPGEEKKVMIFFSPKLSPGLWNMTAVAAYDSVIVQDVFELQVLKEGTLSRTGRIIDVIIVNESKIGDYIKILTRFENNGSAVYEVKSVTEAFVDGRMMYLTESELRKIGPGEVIELKSYFIPQIDEEYTLKIRAEFEGKESNEFVRELFVVGKHNNSPVISLIVLIIIIAGFGYALWKVN